ncbi:urease accessory protein UreD [Mycobacterium sp. M1]|uniref:Urease accessory protein UreD n=1 Tax=Mycolicibacter acidiphilus TaxID=2835306 RepID=A0ABS5RHT9_9MYCO|nr:urease accessory protein UreD [Mycolicibacter acidiphilus]MBS9533872.1 urease accessory protein UreD [Mycolicibacter acidiphilus]
MPPDSSTRMRARSHVATELRSRISCVSTLHAEAPVLLRLTRPKEPDPWPVPGAARVSLTAGAAGPIGGDEYRLDVEVGVGSTLVLQDVSPTLLLPGPDGATSRHTVQVRVAAGATLIWLAEPLIAAHGCRHRQDIAVDLHPSARLLMREELVLGRCGETSGNVFLHSRIRRDGDTLYCQELAVGPDAPGYDGAAVLAGAGAVGSVLVVDPAWQVRPPDARVLSSGAALLPLAGPAALVSAVAADSLALRRDLGAGLVDLGLIR